MRFFSRRAAATRASRQVELNRELLEAAKKGEVQAAASLLKQGANIDFEDEASSDTPLTNAIKSRNAEMITFLLERGANIEAKNNEISPLMWAIKCCNVEIVSLLLKKGANLHKINNRRGWGTPLNYAMVFSSPEVISFLVEQGSNLAYRDEDGFSVGSLFEHSIFLGRGKETNAKVNALVSTALLMQGRNSKPFLDLLKLNDRSGRRRGRLYLDTELDTREVSSMIYPKIAMAIAVMGFNYDSPLKTVYAQYDEEITTAVEHFLSSYDLQQLNYYATIRTEPRTLVYNLRKIRDQLALELSKAVNRQQAEGAVVTKSGLNEGNGFGLQEAKEVEQKEDSVTATIPLDSAQMSALFQANAIVAAMAMEPKENHKDIARLNIALGRTGHLKTVTDPKTIAEIEELPKVTRLNEETQRLVESFLNISALLNEEKNKMFESSFSRHFRRGPGTSVATQDVAAAESKQQTKAQTLSKSENAPKTQQQQQANQPSTSTAFQPKTSVATQSVTAAESEQQTKAQTLSQPKNTCHIL